MFFEESDIDFRAISDTQFEELCFELLLRLGYKKLTWRQGSADNGRDIEGELLVNNSLVENYSEKWFFECKNYSKGVPPEELYSKVAWADAERPNHLTLLLSSHLTNNSRTWLEKITKEKPYFIHLIEGKQLRKIILNFNDIVSKYFSDEYQKLINDAKKNWLVHQLYPSPETLYLLSSKINPHKIAIEDLAFIWCSTYFKNDYIEEWIINNDTFCFEQLFIHLKNHANTNKSLIYDREERIEVLGDSMGTSENCIVYRHYCAAILLLGNEKNARLALYSFVRDNEGEGIEILIESKGDFPTKIRHISNNARSEFLKIIKLLRLG